MADVVDAAHDTLVPQIGDRRRGRAQQQGADVIG